VIFIDVVNSIEKSFVCLSNIECSRIQQWNRRMLLSGLESNLQMIPYRVSVIEVKERFNRILPLVKEILSEIEVLHTTLKPNHFFVVADHSGVTLKIIANEDIIQKLETINIGLGTHYTLEYCGVNAISLAIETGKCAMIRGEEHTLSLFHYASCICAPIRHNNKICAYIAIAIPVRIELNFAVSLVQYVALLIEKRFSRHNLNLEISFKSYELSERQKEIAYHWACGLSYSQIAEILCISTHTVRTILRTVYVKTGVHSKSEFIRKFNENHT
jgi:transcriptional regulator of acetoin/glycerol metabolism